MTCSARHTKFKFEDNDWKCPNCGDEDCFYVDESMGDDDCGFLHNHDYIVCDNCKDSWDGGELAQILLEKASKKTCPHCKGTGLI